VRQRIASTKTVLRRALACVLVLSFAALVMPLPAFAAKAASTPATASATASATNPEIAAMEADFGTKVANYVDVTRELHRTEDDVSQVTSQLASGQADLETARSELATRAVELYRNPSVGLLETLLDANSVGDLMLRLNYLALIADRDAQMLKDMRLAQTEEAWLQESLQIRVVQLQKLQAQADQEQKQLLTDLAAEQAKAAAQNASFVPGVDQSQVTTVTSGSSPSVQFVRSDVVSEGNFRGGTAMTVADIQAFLAKQPGVLKSYSGKDHFGKTKTAAEMISDASVRFNINPKIILATLQKEQSLLTTKHPGQSQFNGAMGAGMPDSGKNNMSMQGFGNQIYWGAQKFDKNARDWHAGATEYVDHNHQSCANEGTFAQYRYTPHYSGVMSFWTIFWRYFGNPLG
jgi:peptidoglycan hydrolase CwlO-like protein